MINVIQVACFIIMTLAIPIVFRIKNWMYYKQKLEIKKSEEYAFLLIMFIALLSHGYIFKQEFAVLISGSFLYWIIYDAIKFDIQLWKEFLKIYRR